MSRNTEPQVGQMVTVYGDPNAEPVRVSRVGWDAKRLNRKVWVERGGETYEFFMDEIEEAS